MMRRRLLLTGALLALLTGCSADVAPGTEPATVSPTPVVSASPTSVPTEGATPQSVFDIGCEDISETMSAFAGSPADAVEQALGLVSAPNWYPGPAQQMAPRAGGVACSHDGEMTEDGRLSGWRVMIVPGAQNIIDALAAEGYSDSTTTCNPGGCVLFARSGDALLSGEIVASGVAPDDTDRMSALAQSWVDHAAASQRPDFEAAPSRLVGAECDQLLQPEQIGSLWDVKAEVADDFGGWSVPAEVYTVVNGAKLCSYSSNAGSYEADMYVFISYLPAGAWALPYKDSQEEITVAGATAAWAGTDAMREGRPFIDLDLDGDWLRITGYAQAPGRDLIEVAGVVAENIGAID